MAASEKASKEFVLVPKYEWERLRDAESKVNPENKDLGLYGRHQINKDNYHEHKQVIEAGNSSKPDGIDGSKKKGQCWIKY